MKIWLKIYKSHALVMLKNFDTITSLLRRNFSFIANSSQKVYDCACIYEKRKKFALKNKASQFLNLTMATPGNLLKGQKTLLWVFLLR